MLLTSEVIDSLLVPLDNQVGLDLRDSSDYESVKQEIDKLASLEGDSPDWMCVGEKSKYLIENETKDISLGAYLTLGQFEKQGIEGLLKGLELLEKMVEDFGENIYPKRPRARIAVVDWLYEQIDALDKKRTFSFVNDGQINRLIEQLDSYEEKIKEVFSYTGEPSLNIVRRAKQQLAKKSSANSQKQKEESQQGRHVELEKVESKEDLVKAEKLSADINVKIAAYHRNQNIRSPDGYRKLRLAVWGGVYDLPINTNGKTQMPPVLPVEREWLDSAPSNEATLLKLEQLLQRYPFWLDLNRKSVEVCTHLGSEFDDVIAVINYETRLMVTRLTGVENLSFSDMEPFANERTQKWLRAIGFGERQDISLKMYSVGDKWQKIERRLSEKGKQNDLQWLVSKLSQIHQSKSDGEEQFHALMLSANLFYANGKLDLAIQCIEQIEKLISKYSLSEWNKSLVKDVYKLKLAVVRGKKEHDEEFDYQAEVKSINKELIGISIFDAYQSGLIK